MKKIQIYEFIYPITVENNSEPMQHIDTYDKHLVNNIGSRVESITRTAAEKVDLHEDVASARLSPIDVLVFGRAGTGKSSLIRAITNIIDIETSPQLNHKTERLQSFTKKIRKLTFRFWDTRGFDSWEGLNEVDNLLSEIKKKNKIQPLFVIYCSSCNERVDSEIVTKILNN